MESLLNEYWGKVGGKKMKHFEKLLIAFFVIFLLVGCGGKSSASDSGSSNGSHQAAESSVATTEAAGIADYYETVESIVDEISDPAVAQEKLVYTGSISIETLGYEETLKNMRELIQKYDGIVESEEEYDNANNWYSTDYQKTRGTKNINLTVRIPTKDFSNFLNSMEGTGKVLNRSTYVENITRQYLSVSTDIESYQIQQRRLLEMMETAQTVEDMITIESRLSEVERQLRQSEIELANMNTDIEYSTVYVTIREVMEYTPDETGIVISNFWNRLVLMFKYSWKYFIYLVQQVILFLVRIFPFVVVFVPIFFVLRWIYHKIPEDVKQFFKNIPSLFKNNKGDKQKEGKKERKQRE